MKQAARLLGNVFAAAEANLRPTAQALQTLNAHHETGAVVLRCRVGTTGYTAPESWTFDRPNLPRSSAHHAVRRAAAFRPVENALDALVACLAMEAPFLADTPFFLMWNVYMDGTTSYSITFLGKMSNEGKVPKNQPTLDGAVAAFAEALAQADPNGQAYQNRRAKPLHPSSLVPMDILE